MNRRNFFELLTAAIGWLWIGKVEPNTYLPISLYRDKRKASWLAWKHADAEGCLRSPTCPRCEVLVDGVKQLKAVEANLRKGWVDLLDMDRFDPSIHNDIPRKRIYGFIDIELLGDGRRC